MRVFYAIGLWNAVDVREIQAFVGQVPQLKWIAPSNTHITLDFLGEVDRSGYAHAARELKTVAALTEPFTLQFAGTGAFPDWSSPRVLWVGLQKDSADRVIDISRALGNSRPSPHVTIARVNGMVSDKALDRFRRMDIDWPDQHVTELLLVESVLSPGGSVYTVRLKAKLGYPAE